MSNEETTPPAAPPREAATADTGVIKFPMERLGIE